VRNLVEDFDGTTALLNNGSSIHFVQLKDMDISGTEIRRRLRAEQSISDLVPLEVENIIRDQHLYEAFDHKIGDFEAFTRFCAKILDDKGGISVLGYDLRELDAPSEFTLISSGTSSRHTQALADSVVRAVKQEYGVYPQSIEGMREGRWIVIDYGSLIVHLFYDYVRQEYRLEELWRAGKAMSSVASPATPKISAQ
jgi:nicotinate-nucleotide adenylyltransferase